MGGGGGGWTAADWVGRKMGSRGGIDAVVVWRGVGLEWCVLSGDGGRGRWAVW